MRPIGGVVGGEKYKTGSEKRSEGEQGWKGNGSGGVVVGLGGWRHYFMCLGMMSKSLML